MHLLAPDPPSPFTELTTGIRNAGPQQYPSAPPPAVTVPFCAQCTCMNECLLNARKIKTSLSWNSHAGVGGAPQSR